MAKNGTYSVSAFQVFLVALLAVILLFILLRCKLRCQWGMGRPESFKRVEYAHTHGGRMIRTPVDYYPWYHSQNPHVKGNPANKFQPLEAGPIDFEADHRKLSSGPEMFHEFSQYHKGSKNAEPWLTNDSKTRMHLRTVGDAVSAAILDDEFSGAHDAVAGGFTHDELDVYIRDNRLTDEPGSDIVLRPALRRLAHADLRN